jgi:hypothetical protein
VNLSFIQRHQNNLDSNWQIGCLNVEPQLITLNLDKLEVLTAMVTYVQIVLWRWCNVTRYVSLLYREDWSRKSLWNEGLICIRLRGVIPRNILVVLFSFNPVKKQRNFEHRSGGKENRIRLCMYEYEYVCMYVVVGKSITKVTWERNIKLDLNDWLNAVKYKVFTITAMKRLVLIPEF